MRPIVTDQVACLSVYLSVCHSPAKTAEPIEMPFGLWARMSSIMTCTLADGEWVAHLVQLREHWALGWHHS